MATGSKLVIVEYRVAHERQNDGIHITHLISRQNFVEFHRVSRFLRIVRFIISRFAKKINGN